MSTRHTLYQIAKYMGDAQAVASGNPERIARRARRRIAYKFVIGPVLRQINRNL